MASQTWFSFTVPSSGVSKLLSRGFLPSASALWPSIRARLPFTATVKVPPSDCVMVTKVSDGIMISVPEGTRRASTSRLVRTTSRSCMPVRASLFQSLVSDYALLIRPTCSVKDYATVKLSPHPHSAVAFGLRKWNMEFTPSVIKSISMPFTRGRCSSLTKTSTPSMWKILSSDATSSTHWVSYLKPEQPLFLMASRMPLASGFFSSCLRTCLTALGVMVTATVGVKTSAVMIPPPSGKQTLDFLQGGKQCIHLVQCIVERE